MRLIRCEVQRDNRLVLALAVMDEGPEHQVSAQTSKAWGEAMAWASISEVSTSSTPTPCYLLTITGRKFRCCGLSSIFLLVFLVV